MEFLQDILAAIGVVLNGIPQGLLALSMGFASVPTALGFGVGVIGCLLLGSVAPISFQAETIVLAGTMGKNMRERLSMVFFAGVTMAALGACGLLTAIVNFAGETVLNAMMAGVGLVLTKLALGMMKENKLVGITSVVTAVLVYFFLGQNLVYTIVISLVVSSAAAKLAGQDIGGGVGTAEKMGRLKLEKPIFNLSVLRGALALPDRGREHRVRLHHGRHRGRLAECGPSYDLFRLGRRGERVVRRRACGGDHLRNGGRAPSRYGGCADDGHHGRHSVLRPAAQDR